MEQGQEQLLSPEMTIWDLSKVSPVKAMLESNNQIEENEIKTKYSDNNSILCK